MSVLIDEDRARTLRPGLAGGFAEGPPGGGAGNPAQIWRRLWFTLVALIVYRIGSYLPLPGLDLVALSELRHISYLVGGPWIPDQSIVSLGIMPYISAFIIVELAKRIVPRLGGQAALEPAGRRKLNQCARILTVVLAVLQAVGIAGGFENLSGVVTVPAFLFEVMTVLTLVAGAIFVMWLAEQITAHGIGEGALVMLACGIVGELPFVIARQIESVKMGDFESYWLLAMLLMTAAIVVLVVVVEGATRWISIHDPRGEMGARAPDGRYAHIALKLNPTQVWAPVAGGIFATALPGIIASIGGFGGFLYGKLMIGSGGYLLFYALLIALFAVSFGLAAFDPERTARTLEDSGGLVPGYRPGENTAQHLRRIQTALAVIGAAYLVVACVLPTVIYRWADLWPPFGDYEIFLVAWLMVRILGRMRPFERTRSAEAGQ